jgi:hypothetical protein
MKAHIINKVPKGNFKTYHLTRALNLHEIKKIDCKKISCSPSTFERLSKKTKDYLKENNFKITIEKNKGKPLQTKPKKILQAIKLYRTGKSLRKIENELGLPKSTVHYLIKHAKKTKIKKGSTVISV